MKSSVVLTKSINRIAGLVVADKQFLWGVVFIAGSNLIGRAFGFLYPVVLARIISPEELGIVNYSIAIAFLMGKVVYTGFPQALTRYLAVDDESEKNVYVINTMIATAFILIASLLVGGTILRISGKPYIDISIVLIGLTIDYFYFGLLRGFFRDVRLSIYRVLANIIQILLILIAYWLGFTSPRIMLIIYGFVYLIPMAAIEIIRPMPIRLNLINLSIPILKKLSFFAVPVILSSIAFGIFSTIDTILLQDKQGYATVGYYGAAKSLTNIFMIVPFGVTTVLMPKVASLTEHRMIRQYLKTSFLICGAISIGFLIICLPFAKPILALVFKPEYAVMTTEFQLMSVAMALYSLSSVVLQTFTGYGNLTVPIIILTFAGLLDGLFCWILIPGYGARGAALGFCFASAILFVAYLFLAWYTFRQKAAS